MGVTRQYRASIDCPFTMEFPRFTTKPSHRPFPSEPHKRIPRYRGLTNNTQPPTQSIPWRFPHFFHQSRFLLSFSVCCSNTYKHKRTTSVLLLLKPPPSSGLISSISRPCRAVQSARIDRNSVVGVHYNWKVIRSNQFVSK